MSESALKRGGSRAAGRRRPVVWRTVAAAGSGELDAMQGETHVDLGTDQRRAQRARARLDNSSRRMQIHVIRQEVVMVRSVGRLGLVLVLPMAVRVSGVLRVMRGFPVRIGLSGQGMGVGQ